MCEAGTFITIAEAAQMLETTETRILMMLKKIELQGKMEDGGWYVDRSSLNLCNKPQASDIVKPGGCGICGSGCGSGC
jgi:hypothetical protein